MGFLDSRGLARFKAKIDTLIAGKLAKNQGTSNAGLFMKINTDGELIPGPVPDPTGKADKVTRATSGNFAGLDTNGNLTDSGSKASDFLQQSQGVVNAGKIVKVNDSGYLELAAIETSKLVVFNLDTVTNTSGPYSHTTQIAAASHDMQALVINVADPSVFKSAISITPIDGGITLECDSVEGTSAVSVSCMFIANANKFTSNEFDILANRITETADDLSQEITNKVDKPVNVPAGKFLQTDSNGNEVWGNAASPTDVTNAVTDWLDDNIPTGQTVVVDQSLTVNGAAADAKKTGDEISDLKSAFNNLGLSVVDGEINITYEGAAV